jgi:hypothetical protein
MTWKGFNKTKTYSQPYKSSQNLLKYNSCVTRNSQSNLVRILHPILSHMRQYTIVGHLPKIRNTLTLPCRSNLRSAKWPLIFTFSTTIWYEFLISLVHALCSAYLVFDFIIVNLVNLQTLKLLIIQLSPASCYVLRLRSRYCPQNFNLKNPRSVFFPSSNRPKS